ncbi:LacI family transcriptional regulator [Enemella evansiae]|uniref:LacI family DNA-binding transcriptional regulator n=1 Tax=Enemella evansiae TaxID=2016499 RepID=UPI000B95EA6B|nr:LacI family DNA-binding transcriptional regulator [Enemella evansiae]OYO13736.1 LacI family transcriptional regulator [Enemella evansiae]
METDSMANTGLRRYPSIRDVAKAAGVSYQTVSRVLNDLPDVAPATRTKVLAAVDELGYRRNLTARNLATNRSTTIGIVTDDSPRLGPVSTLMALEKAARQRGSNCSVVTVAEPYSDTVPTALRGLEEVGVHGIVVIAPVVSAAAAVRAARVRTPLVLIAAGEDSAPGLLAFAENQELGARIATQHLLRLGHTDIVHVAGSQDWFDGRTRLRGWAAEMREAGLPADRWYESDWTPRFAYDVGKKLVVEGLPTAVFAASDHMALGLLRAFAESGVRVPEDVSVVGYDDAEGSDFYFPPLTTVRQDFMGLATRSLELLDKPTDDPFGDEPPTEPLLQIRQSTARPRR